MKVPHSPRRLRLARLLAALAVAAALAAPERAHALSTEWANVQPGTPYVTVDFRIDNDNPGTTYTSVTLSSVIPLFEALYAANRAYYPSVAALIGGSEGGLPNWLAAETAGRRQFRVRFADAPGGTDWADLRVCASTGSVTEVCETNAAPRRFYRVVSP